MITRLQDCARLLAYVVTVLVGLLAVVFGTPHPASAAAGGETCVRASAEISAPLVGPSKHVSPVQGRGSVVAEPGLVVATGVAANGGLFAKPITVSAHTAKFELKALGGSRYESPAGLIYRPGSKHGHRLSHVLQHTVPDSSKPAHGVFSRRALETIDEAWASRGASVPGDAGAYIVPMGRSVGTNGENAVRIIVKPGTSEIISAYPWVVP